MNQAVATDTIAGSDVQMVRAVISDDAGTQGTSDAGTQVTTDTIAEAVSTTDTITVAVSTSGSDSNTQDVATAGAQVTTDTIAEAVSTSGSDSNTNDFATAGTQGTSDACTQVTTDTIAEAVSTTDTITVAVSTSGAGSTVDTEPTSHLENLLSLFKEGPSDTDETTDYEDDSSDYDCPNLLFRDRTDGASASSSSDYSSDDDSIQEDSREDDRPTIQVIPLSMYGFDVLRHFIIVDGSKRVDDLIYRIPKSSKTWLDVFDRSRVLVHEDDSSKYYKSRELREVDDSCLVFLIYVYFQCQETSVPSSTLITKPSPTIMPGHNDALVCMAARSNADLLADMLQESDEESHEELLRNGRQMQQQLRQLPPAPEGNEIESPGGSEISIDDSEGMYDPDENDGDVQADADGDVQADDEFARNLSLKFETRRTTQASPVVADDAVAQGPIDDDKTISSDMDTAIGSHPVPGETFPKTTVTQVRSSVISTQEQLDAEFAQRIANDQEREGYMPQGDHPSLRNPPRIDRSSHVVDTINQFENMSVSTAAQSDDVRSTTPGNVHLMSVAGSANPAPKSKPRLDSPKVSHAGNQMGEEEEYEGNSNSSTAGSASQDGGRKRSDMGPSQNPHDIRTDPVVSPHRWKMKCGELPQFVDGSDKTVLTGLTGANAVTGSALTGANAVARSVPKTTSWNCITCADKFTSREGLNQHWMCNPQHDPRVHSRALLDQKRRESNSSVFGYLCNSANDLYNMMFDQQDQIDQEQQNELIKEVQLGIGQHTLFPMNPDWTFEERKRVTEGLQVEHQLNLENDDKSIKNRTAGTRGRHNLDVTQEGGQIVSKKEKYDRFSHKDVTGALESDRISCKDLTEAPAPDPGEPMIKTAFHLSREDGLSAPEVPEECNQQTLRRFIQAQIRDNSELDGCHADDFICGCLTDVKDEESVVWFPLEDQDNFTLKSMGTNREYVIMAHHKPTCPDKVYAAINASNRRSMTHSADRATENEDESNQVPDREKRSAKHVTFEHPQFPEDILILAKCKCGNECDASLVCQKCQYHSSDDEDRDINEAVDDLHDDTNVYEPVEALAGQAFMPHKGKLKPGCITQKKSDGVRDDCQRRHEDATENPLLLLKRNAALTRFNTGCAPFRQEWYKKEYHPLVDIIESVTGKFGQKLVKVSKAWETAHPSKEVHRKLAKGKFKEIFHQMLKHIDRKGNKPHPILRLVIAFGKKGCMKELVFVLKDGTEVCIPMRTGHYTLFNAFSGGGFTGIPHFSRHGEETLVVVMEIVPLLQNDQERATLEETQEAIINALEDINDPNKDEPTELEFHSPPFLRDASKCMDRPSEDETDVATIERFNQTFRPYILSSTGLSGSETGAAKYGFDTVSEHLKWLGEMGMEAGAKKNNMTVEEWAAHMGEKGMEAGAKRNNMTVEEWAAHMGEKGMEAGAKRNNMTVEEWAAHCGQKGGEAAAKAVREKYGCDERGKSIVRVENMKILVGSKGKTKDDKCVQAVESGNMSGLKKMTERHEKMREHWKDKKIKQKGKTFKAKTDAARTKKVEEQGGLLVEKKYFACECGHVSHREAAVVPEGKSKGLVIILESKGLPDCMKCNTGKKKQGGKRCMLLKQEEVLKNPKGPWSFDADGVMLWSFWCNHHFEKTKSEDRVYRKWCEDMEEKKKAETVKYEVPNGGDPKLTPLSMRDVKTMSTCQCREKFKLLGLKQKVGENTDGMRRRIMAAYKMKPNGGEETKRGSIMNFVEKK